MTAEAPSAPQKEKSPLRYLHDTQTSLEKFRISVNNRVAAITGGADEAERPVPETYAEILAQAEKMESTIDRAIAQELKKWPVYDQWLRHVRGVGPGLAGQMLALLFSPADAPGKGPSAWYKAAGIAPEIRDCGTNLRHHDPDDGENAGEGFWACPYHPEIQESGPGKCTQLINRLPRARAGGGKLTYHPWLRRCLYNLSTSLIRQGAYYRDIYDQRKRRLFNQHAWKAGDLMTQWESVGAVARGEWLRRQYTDEEITAVIKAMPGEAERSIDNFALNPTMNKAYKLAGQSDPTWDLLRIDRVARWSMTKLFLSHLWEAWAEVQGIPSRTPYIVEYGGHHLIPRPRPNPNGEKI